MKNKKSKKVIDRNFRGEDKEVSRAIKIVVGVVLTFALIYLLAALFTGEINLKKEKESEPTIQYVEILAERTFKQKDSDYFVLYYDFEDEATVGLFDTVFESLKETASAYKVDLSKKFNANYLVEDSKNVDTTPENLEELKVKNPTLIRIKDGKVDKFVNGVENIKNYSLKLK